MDTNEEKLKIAIKALEDVSTWTFGWDGDCGVTRCADEALSAIEAIAPPVAAGSVDTEGLDKALQGMQTADGAGYAGILAWGAQQREAEKLKVEQSVVLAVDQAHQQAKDAKYLANELRQRAEKAEADVIRFQQERDNLLKLAVSRREWAEKAEADIAKADAAAVILVGEMNYEITQRHAAEKALKKAEARVKELERALSNGTAKPSLLNSDSFVGSNEQT